MNKKIFLLPLLALTLAGCGPTEPAFAISIVDADGGTSATMTVGDPDLQLSIVTDPAEQEVTVTWESLDEEVVTVTDDGLVHAVGRGAAAIKATAVSDDRIVDEFAISVLQPRTSLQDLFDNGVFNAQEIVVGKVVVNDAGHSNQITISDSADDAIVIYNGNTAHDDIEVGDIVKVTGTVACYGYMMQLTNATYEVLEGEDAPEITTVVTPVELTAAAINTYGEELEGIITAALDAGEDPRYNGEAGMFREVRPLVYTLTDMELVYAYLDGNYVNAKSDATPDWTFAMNQYNAAFFELTGEATRYFTVETGVILGSNDRWDGENRDRAHRLVMYFGGEDGVELAERPKPTQIVVTAPEDNTVIAVGQDVQLSAVAKDAAGGVDVVQDVTWSIEAASEEFLTVSATGLVTGVKVTETPIVVTATSVADTAVSGTISLTVSAELSGEQLYYAVQSLSSDEKPFGGNTSYTALVQKTVAYNEVEIDFTACGLNDGSGGLRIGGRSQEQLAKLTGDHYTDIVNSDGGWLATGAVEESINKITLDMNANKAATVTAIYLEVSSVAFEHSEYAFPATTDPVVRGATVQQAEPVEAAEQLDLIKVAAWSQGDTLEFTPSEGAEWAAGSFFRLIVEIADGQDSNCTAIISKLALFHDYGAAVQLLISVI